MFFWILYIIAACVSLINFIKDAKIAQFVVFLYLYVFLVFIAGFKYASIDYIGYVELYYETNISDFSIPFFTVSLSTTGMEFVWATSSSLFRLIGMPFTVWVFFVALLSITIKFYFFKKYSPYFLLVVAIYVVTGFVKDMGQLRSGLSAAVLLFAVQPVVKREGLKFLAVVIVAFGIQVYSIVALPLYWLYPLYTKQKSIFMAVLVGAGAISASGGVAEYILSSFFGISFVPDAVMRKVEGYSGVEADNLSILTLTGSVFFVIAIVNLVFLDKIRSKDERLAVFSMFHFYGVLLFLVFTGIATVANRSLDLFSLSSLPFILVAPLYFFRSYDRYIYLGFIFVFCALRLYSNMGALYPYQNILFK